MVFWSPLRETRTRCGERWGHAGVGKGSPKDVWGLGVGGGRIRREFHVEVGKGQRSGSRVLQLRNSTGQTPPASGAGRSSGWWERGGGPGLGGCARESAGPAQDREKLSCLVTRKRRFSEGLTCLRSHSAVSALFGSQSCLFPGPEKNQSRKGSHLNVTLQS